MRPATLNFLGYLLSVPFFHIAFFGCIQVAKNETNAIHLQESRRNLSAIQMPSNVKIEFQIYQYEKLPLNDFFYHLKNGDLSNAIQGIDFKYIPSNMENEAIERLFENGLLPVFIKIHNFETKSINISEENFLLLNNDEQLRPISTGQMPKVFSEFNPSAVAANFVNVAGVIVGFSVLILLMAEGTRHNSYNFGSLDFPSASPSRNGGENSSVINSTEKNIHIDYRDYLIGKTEIPPNSILEGLVFFKSKGPAHRTSYKLMYLP